MLKRLLYLVLLPLAVALDFANKNYFVVELNTTLSQKPLIDFIASHQEYHFEYQSPLDDHYVFSVNKLHSHNLWLGNYNSNEFNLMKRSPEALELVLNPHLKSVHMLPPKTLQKRMPVYYNVDDYPVDETDELNGEKDANLPENSLNSENTKVAISPPYAANVDKRLDIVDSSQLPIKIVAEKLDINDPMFIKQWHLVNAEYPGNDVNVSGLWYEGITGEGITAAIIDDGLDAESPDLKDNFNAKGSWDFNDNTNLPMPRLYDDHHGTRCAGEIAAVKNDVCGVGVAYNSKVSGIRILSGPITSEQEAQAMIYGLDVNDIYSCSWGPTDDGRTLSEPDVLVKKAMIKGIQDGRKGKGSIYVFASGNGGRFQDSCNFDGYTNSIYSITVGAIDYKGLHPTYAEPCSAVMVVTYSSGSRQYIHTTDINHVCSSSHGGTSAAAPLAAGIFTLVLQVNPELTWRDLQYVALMSTVPVNDNDGDYQLTALNRKYSHKYGYGKIDAYAMVHFGKNWKNVKPQTWYYSDIMEVRDTLDLKGTQSLNHRDDGDEKKMLTHTITVTEDDLKVMNLERVEHLTVKVNILATDRGKTGVRLISPSGVVSDLATFRPQDHSGKGFVNWTFMSVAHWGESGLGDWKIEVFGDENSATDNHIIFNDWQLRFFGESIDAEKAEKYNLDTDYAQVRRDRLADLQAKPEEPEEPEKPQEPEESKPEESKPEESQPEESKPEDSKPEESKPEKPQDEEETPEPTGEPENDNEDGKKKQSTVDHTGQYFMAIAVVGFIVVVIFMKFHKTPGSGRRKRRRRDEYEFDIIPGEDYSDSDAEELDSLDITRARHDMQAERDQQRLYDEFNADSLPEYQEGEEMFKIGDEEEEEDRSDPKESKSTDTKSSDTKSSDQIHEEGESSKEHDNEDDRLLK